MRLHKSRHVCERECEGGGGGGEKRGVVLVAATSARVLLRRAPAGMVEKQLVHASATPTSPELGPRGSSLHDKRQLTLLCLSLT